MKSKKPKKLKNHPELKLSNERGSKSGSGKKSRSNNNRRFAIIHSVFRVRNPKTKCIYTVLLALCAKKHMPWKDINFGEMVDKHSFRDQLQYMEQLDDN